MELELELRSALPPQLLVTVQIDEAEWRRADENGRNDIIAIAMNKAVLQLVQDDRIELNAVFIEGEEYVQE
jgi:hypothetical protein